MLATPVMCTRYLCCLHWYDNLINQTWLKKQNKTKLFQFSLAGVLGQFERNFSQTSVSTRRSALKFGEFTAYMPSKFKSASIVVCVRYCARTSVFLMSLVNSTSDTHPTFNPLQCEIVGLDMRSLAEYPGNRAAESKCVCVSYVCFGFLN